MLKVVNSAIIIFIASFLFSFHPFYLGVTHFKLNSKSNTLETSVKLFTNDFETSLKNLNGKSVDLINGSNKEEINKLINKYLQMHLNIKVNDKIAAFNYIGFEIEKDVTWIYIEYKKIKSLKSLEVENTLLYESFNKQTHILRVESATGEQNSKISCPEKTAKFFFK